MFLAAYTALMGIWIGSFDIVEKGNLTEDASGWIIWVVERVREPMRNSETNIGVELNNDLMLW